MIDVSFLENVSAEELTPSDKKDNELQQLVDLANYVGSYTYQYKDGVSVHDGVIAQELLQVPGLRDAVKKGPDDSLTIDTGHVALATLGYVAALVRAILGEPANTSTPEDIKVQEEILKEKPINGERAEDLINESE